MRKIVRRVVVVIAASAVGAIAPVAGAAPLPGAALGALLGLLAVGLEARAASARAAALLCSAAGGGLGLLVGLAVGVIVATLLPGAGRGTLALPAILGVYVGAVTALARIPDLEGASTLAAAAPRRGARDKILDTSVIIDGRIADLCASGLLEGTLVVPRFVLGELQRIADSPDAPRRNRGRRGFEILDRLQRAAKPAIEIDAREFAHAGEVDQKLVELARARGGKLVTNDANLGRLAGLCGVEVLNINELANAVRPVLLPGEGLTVQVQREGRELGQGVAYLDDGTMVVVEQGKRHIGQRLDVIVTSVLQTPAGRMIFARMREEATAGRDA